jgi:hypothetical protein
MSDRPAYRINFVSLILALFLLGCSAPQRPQQDLLAQMYMKSSSELFSLRFVYNSCKDHLTSDGQGKARICQEIASVKGDDKSQIIARAILDDFKVANQGKPWTVSTHEGVLYFTFMKMQAERHLRGETVTVL